MGGGDKKDALGAMTEKETMERERTKKAPREWRGQKLSTDGEGGDEKEALERERTKKAPREWRGQKLSTDGEGGDEKEALERERTKKAKGVKST